MDKERKDFEVVDHTADIGLKIYGKNREELFINAARGMVCLIIGSDISNRQKSIKNRYPIESNGSDIEDLLVNWLNELLFLNATELIIPVDYTIDSLTDEIIRSHVAVIPIKDSPYRIIKEIKAVTYHGLYIRQVQDDRWEGNIVFDI